MNWIVVSVGNLVPETWMQIGIPRVVGCQVLTSAIDATIGEL